MEKILINLVNFLALQVMDAFGVWIKTNKEFSIMPDIMFLID